MGGHMKAGSRDISHTEVEIIYVVSWTKWDIQRNVGGRDPGSKGDVKKNLGEGLHLEDDREGKNLQVVQKGTKE